MARNIKARDFVKEGVELVRDNLPKYKSLWETLKEHMDDEKEQVYMLIFNDKKECIFKENVSIGGGNVDSVEHDKVKIEKLFQEMIDNDFKYWGLSHNHPFMKNDKGEWVETFVSPGDIVVTNNIKSVAGQIGPVELEYVGHYVVNKEDTYEKIIGIEDRIKFNGELIDKIEKGEL